MLYTFNEFKELRLHQEARVWQTLDDVIIYYK